MAPPVGGNPSKPPSLRPLLSHHSGYSRCSPKALTILNSVLSEFLASIVTGCSGGAEENDKNDENKKSITPKDIEDYLKSTKNSVHYTVFNALRTNSSEEKESPKKRRKKNSTLTTTTTTATKLSHQDGDFMSIAKDAGLKPSDTTLVDGAEGGEHSTIITIDDEDYD